MIITDNSMEALVCLKERIDNELENVREKVWNFRRKKVNSKGKLTYWNR